MLEARLLAQALGRPGRLALREPLGAGAIAGFDVDVDGETRTYFVDTSGRPVPTEPGCVLRERGEQVGRIWQHPADPRLPMLAAATDPASAAALVEPMGIVGPVTPTLLAYRPTKRAVVRLQHADGAAYLKVMRPNHVEHIIGVHERFEASGMPTAHTIGWSPDGFIVQCGARGVAGPEATLTTSAGDLVAAVDDLRERLEGVEITSRARASLATRADWYCDRLVTVAPDLAGILEPIARFVLPAVHSTVGRSPVHGDLHLGQLFFGEPGVTAVIDLDTAGVGDADDDSASFISHALVSALMNEERGHADAAAALDDVATLAAEQWLVTAHARALTAVHLLAHAVKAAQDARHESASRLVRFASQITVE